MEVLSSSRLGFAAFVGVLCGCAGTVGPKPDSVTRAASVQALENENETLRRELESYRDEATARERTIDLAILPRPTSVVEARGSAVRTGPGGDSLQWRVRSEDRRGRLVQTTGPVRVMAGCFDEDGATVDLGRWKLSPDAWSRSLREGVLGGSYAIDVPLDRPLPQGVSAIQVRLELEDPRCDATLELNSIVPVIRDDPPESRS